MIYVRFWRRIRLSSRIFLNISKTGASITFVFLPLHFTFGRKGLRVTYGIRGTGLSFMKYLRYKK